MKNGTEFDFDGFLAYMNNNFQCVESCFVRKMLANLVDYALKEKSYSLDSAIFFLSDIIPEVEFGEIAMFADDSILTSFGKAEGQKAREELEAKACQFTI